MTTSRTGTATWKNLRRRVIAKAKRAGITQCPHCRRDLDYTAPRLPNSVEVDHIVPHANGGKDVLSNVTVLCRTCNGRKGKHGLPQTVTQPQTTRQW